MDLSCWCWTEGVYLHGVCDCVSFSPGSLRNSEVLKIVPSFDGLWHKNSWKYSLLKLFYTVFVLNLLFEQICCNYLSEPIWLSLVPQGHLVILFSVGNLTGIFIFILTVAIHVMSESGKYCSTVSKIIFYSFVKECSWDWNTLTVWIKY